MNQQGLGKRRTPLLKGQGAQRLGVLLPELRGQEVRMPIRPAERAKPLGAVLAETALAGTRSWDPDFLDLDRAVLAQR